MSVRRGENGTIVLEGLCPAEDAETLLQMLHTSPQARLDWTRCERLHTAVLQVILVARSVPAGPCGDPWIERWVVHNML